MPTPPDAILVRVGPRVIAVGPGGRIVGERVIVGDEAAAAGEAARVLVRSALRTGAHLQAADGALLSLLRSAGVSASPASILEARRARESAWPRGPPVPRVFWLETARRALGRAWEDPDEILATLAREEERTERAVGRERAAAAQWPPAEPGELEGYRRDWERARAALERHHAHLLERVARAVRARAPNLTAVVGPRAAARLLAAAGGLPTLARMDASRLQLLGARRRPAPGPGARGPRFGLLYRAERMDDVPPARRGAYARTLAGLASIAARVDLATQRDLSSALVARRDRRVSSLRQPGRDTQ